MKKDLLDKIKIVIFLAFLIVPGAVFYIYCAFNPGSFQTLTFDKSENRSAAAFPTITQMATSGNPLMDYYNDRVPFRLEVIKFYRKMNGALETPYRDNMAPVLAKVFYVEPTKQLAANEGDESEISELDEFFMQDEFADYMDGDGTDVVDYSASEITEAGGMEEVSAVVTAEKELIIPGKEENDSETGSEKTSEKASEIISEKTSETASEVTSETTSELTSDVKQVADGNTVDPNAPVTPETPTQQVVAPDPSQVTIATPPAAAVENGEYFAPITSGQALLGRENWLFLNDGRNLPYYTGENILSNGDMAAYLQRMEMLNNICAQRGIILGYIICPDKNQVYTEYMPTIPRVNTYTRVHRFTDYVKTADPGIHLSYPLYELTNAKAVGQCYYRYDTHWNNLGAFIGVQNLYANMGLPSVGLESVGITEQYGFFASDLARLGNIDVSDYPPDRDYVINYRPDVSITSCSGTGNDGIYTSTTDNPNGLKLALVGDSYRVRMAPYVEKDFSQSTILHRNNVPQAAAQIRECNVLIVECVERYDKEMFTNLNQLITVLSN